MSSSQSDVEPYLGALEGSINGLIRYTDGVIIGVDSRMLHKGNISSDECDKFYFISKALVATMCGHVMFVDAVWDVLAQEVNKSSFSVSNATLQAVKFINENIRVDQSCSLFIIGKNAQGLETNRIKKSKEKKLYFAKRIKQFDLIGAVHKIAQLTLLEGYLEFMSETQAVELMRKTLLIASLQKSSVGGYIIIRGILETTGEASLITREPVLNVLLDYYDDEVITKANSEENTVFFLTKDKLGDDMLQAWLSHGHFLPPTETRDTHILGKVRGGYYLRRVYLINQTADDIIYQVSAICEGSDFQSGCEDEVIKPLPYLYIYSALFHFGKASKELLEKLCDGAWD